MTNTTHDTPPLGHPVGLLGLATRQRPVPLLPETDRHPMLTLQATRGQPAVARLYQGSPSEPVGEMLAHGVRRFYLRERRFPTKITLSLDDYHRYPYALPKAFACAGASGEVQRIPLARDRRLRGGQFCCEAGATCAEGARETDGERR